MTFLSRLPIAFRNSQISRFARNEDGVVAVLFVILLPALLLAGALAIDLMHINAERRYVQSQADLAALSAAHRLTSAEESRGAARATVAANPVYSNYTLADGDIVFGTAPVPGSFEALADQTTTNGATAVHVTVSAPVQLYLLDMFMSDEGLVVRRDAIAAIDPPRVSFALSNCLAELALLNGLLRPLIGAEVDVLCSGSGIDIGVDLFETLGDIALRANLLTPSGDPVTYGQLLDADLPVADILSVLTGIAVPPGGGAVRLGDALILSDDIRRLSVNTPVHSVQLQVSDLVMMTAELLARNVVSIEAALDLGPLADVGARVTVGEPRRLVANVIPGSPEAYASTSQISIELDTINVLNIFTLEIDINLANASAQLSDDGNACAIDASDVVAVFNPVDASLLDIALKTQASGLPVGSQALGFNIDTASDRETRVISFTRQQYDEDPVARLGPVGDPAEQAVVALLEDTLSTMLDETAETLQAGASLHTCTGLLGCLGHTLDALGSLLNATATLLVSSSVNIVNGLGADGTLTNAILADLVGLELARANLELLEVICPNDMPRLIR